MSTPIIPEQTFANVRHSLQYYAPINSGMLGSMLCRAIACDFFGTDIEQKDTRIAALVFDWQRANHSAHIVRYYARTKADAWKAGEGPEGPSPTLPDGKRLGVAALLKACQCVRYNCDQGEASGESLRPSLAALDEIIDALKDSVIEDVKEYQDAEWPL